MILIGGKGGGVCSKGEQAALGCVNESKMLRNTPSCGQVMFIACLRC